MGKDVRTFVDALGGLNQQAAAACERVTLMSAGLPLTLKVMKRLLLIVLWSLALHAQALQVTDDRGVAVDLPRPPSAS